MRTDESGAPWPYASLDVGEEEGAPTWSCPEETCACSEHAAPKETYEFSVMLCAPDGQRLPGARCRILANGKLANMDMPYADREGWVTAVIDRVPETVLVEWAPAELPDSPRLPYRRRYYVNLREDSERESTRRRLHNLGFSYFSTLRENIKDFQCEYGEEITGEIADITEKLRLYHDAAMVPITSIRKPRPWGRDRGAPQGGIVLAAFGPMADPDGPSGGGGTAPSPPSPPKGGSATKVGTGTVKLSVSPAIYLKSIVDLVDNGEAAYQWRQLVVTNKDMSMVGHFWIFVDALKDRKTGRRWPCTAAESQMVARKIKTTPNVLPGWVEPKVVHVGPSAVHLLLVAVGQRRIGDLLPLVVELEVVRFGVVRVQGEVPSVRVDGCGRLDDGRRPRRDAPAWTWLSPGQLRPAAAEVDSKAVSVTVRPAGVAVRSRAHGSAHRASAGPRRRRNRMRCDVRSASAEGAWQ